jgi:hypothetical protein
MDESVLRGHLERAERHVAEGHEHVRRQRILIDELERDGHDSTQARELLARFEDALALHLKDLERLRKAVGPTI